MSKIYENIDLINNSNESIDLINNSVDNLENWKDFLEVYRIDEKEIAELSNGIKVANFDLVKFDIFNSKWKDNLNYCNFCEFFDKCNQPDEKYYIGICDEFQEKREWLNGLVFYREK